VRVLLSKPHALVLWSVGVAALVCSGAAHLGHEVTVPTITAAPLYVLAAPTLVPTPTAAPQPTPVPPLQSGQAAPAILDEAFTSNALGWPDNRQATGWFIDNGYQLEPRVPGQFVAVTPEKSPVLDDVSVSAVFHKIAGRPEGGGYGIIVRDQSDTQLDGWRTSGRYYVFELSDRGEVGVFRREDDHWDTLLDWTPSVEAHSGAAQNELAVEARGDRLSLVVNGGEAVQVVDSTLGGGRVGVFVGGDGNAAVLSRLVVRPLT
jgi:hypothetical protein